MEGDTFAVIIKDFIRTLFTVIKSMLTAYLSCIFGLFSFLPRRYKDISQDVILVTGGGRGIGRLIAVELAKHKPKMVGLTAGALLFLRLIVFISLKKLDTCYLVMYTHEKVYNRVGHPQIAAKLLSKYAFNQISQ